MYKFQCITIKSLRYSAIRCCIELISDMSKIWALYQNMLHSEKGCHKHGKLVGLPLCYPCVTDSESGQDRLLLTTKRSSCTAQTLLQVWKLLLQFDSCLFNTLYFNKKPAVINPDLKLQEVWTKTLTLKSQTLLGLLVQHYTQQQISLLHYLKTFLYLFHQKTKTKARSPFYIKSF